jgi:hypothetical protein
LLRPWYYEVELLQTGLALFVTVFFIVLVFATGGFGICLCEPFSHNRLGLQSTWLTVGFASPKEMRAVHQNPQFPVASATALLKI